MEKRKGVSDLYLFNLAKGVALIGVILVHTILAFLPQERTGVNRLYQIPAAFVSYGMMSLFFMTSGYYTKVRPNKKFIDEKFKHMFPLYIDVAVISCVITLIWKTVAGKDILDTLIYSCLPYALAIPKGGQIGSFSVNSVGPIWFLLAIMNAGIILNAILNMKSKNIQIALIVGLVVAGWGLSFIEIMPFCISQSLITVGYLYVGKLISDKKLMYVDIPKWCYIIGVGIVLLCSCFGSIDMAQNVYRLGLIDIAASFLAGFLGMRFFAYLNKYTGKIVTAIGNIGFLSTGVYCAHSIELMCLPWYKVVEKFANHIWIGIPVLLLGHAVCIFFFNRVIKYNIQRRFNKGRKRKLKI